MISTSSSSSSSSAFPRISSCVRFFPPILFLLLLGLVFFLAHRIARKNLRRRHALSLVLFLSRNARRAGRTNERTNKSALLRFDFKIKTPSFYLRTNFFRFLNFLKKKREKKTKFFGKKDPLLPILLLLLLLLKTFAQKRSVANARTRRKREREREREESSGGSTEKRRPRSFVRSFVRSFIFFLDEKTTL